MNCWNLHLRLCNTHETGTVVFAWEYFKEIILSLLVLTIGGYLYIESNYCPIDKRSVEPLWGQESASWYLSTSISNWFKKPKKPQDSAASLPGWCSMHRDWRETYREWQQFAPWLLPAALRNSAGAAEGQGDMKARTPSPVAVMVPKAHLHPSCRPLLLRQGDVGCRLRGR